MHKARPLLPHPKFNLRLHLLPDPLVLVLHKTSGRHRPRNLMSHPRNHPWLARRIARKISTDHLRKIRRSARRQFIAKDKGCGAIHGSKKSSEESKSGGFCQGTFERRGRFKTMEQSNPQKFGRREISKMHSTRRGSFPKNARLSIHRDQSVNIKSPYIRGAVIPRCDWYFPPLSA